ncbi:alpha/beta hydrolase family protein [Aestuariibius insulae]|uniref:alpha/beta hydrolase family protein n=1 Tax=Aestuariibius insulae TaxID=2058287 RepID=UPI00345EF8E6
MTRLIMLAALALATAADAQTRIDVQRPDAPEQAAYGSYAVGVRTLELTRPDLVDVTAIAADAPLSDPLPLTDRQLVTEVWYPAGDGADGATTMDAYLRDGRTVVTLAGLAVRDAKPSGDGPFPLVIVSHGYPGNRFLLAHLAENIASKGYVVASIDHQDSTYRDQDAFGSTLVHRPGDQVFVLEEMARLDAEVGFLEGLVDAERTAIVGYSMGGYGAVIAAGGGVSEAAVDLSFGAPHGLLSVNRSGAIEAPMDPRIQTIIAFAPWGRSRDVWTAEGLGGVAVPTFLIAGSQDDVSGYEDGVRLMWEEMTGTDRALLTFEHANHNAAAPYPAPDVSYQFDEELGFAPFEHYADAVWDTTRMNNIAQHFVTVWLDAYLRGEAEAVGYLDLIPVAEEGVWAMDESGNQAEDHTYWRGFANRTAKGLRFEWLRAGE